MMNTRMLLFVALNLALVTEISAGEIRQARALLRMPQEINEVVTIPSALSAAMSDKLAEQAKGVLADAIDNTTAMMDLDVDVVAALVRAGVLGSDAEDVLAAAVKTPGNWSFKVPVKMEQGNMHLHADKPPLGDEHFDFTTLVYLTDAKGTLHFRETNEFVNIRKGRAVAFPAGVLHEVLDGEPRIILGPFTKDSNAHNRQRRLDSVPVDVADVAWLEKRGCCRQRVSGVPKRKRFLSHHDNLIDETEIVGGTMANAMDRCQEDCLGNDLCTAFEVHKSKKTKAKNAKKNKKRSKGYKCELHKAAINDASRKSKSCKKAQCFIKDESSNTECVGSPSPACCESCRQFLGANCFEDTCG